MKKTKTYLITLFIIFNVSLLFGQNKTKEFDFVWGPILKESSSFDRLDNILGYYNDRLYMLRSKLGAYRIEYYNSKMEKIKSAKIDIDFKEYDINKSIILNNKIYLFYSILDLKNKKNVFYVQTIDINTLKRIDNKAITRFDYDKKYNCGNYGVTISRDSSKFLVNFDLPYSKENRIRFVVLDKNMDIIWKDEKKLNLIKAQFNIVSNKISNNGNVYFIGKYYFSDKTVYKKENDGLPNYKYMFYGFNYSLEEQDEFQIKYKDNFLGKMKLVLDNEDVYCAGFYSKTIDNVIGSYFIKIDKTMAEAEYEIANDFGVNFNTQGMKEYEKEKVEKGKNKSIRYMELDTIIINNSNELTLIGEVSGYSFLGSEDNLIINMSKDGEINWTTKVFKRQNLDKYTTSYSLFKKDNDLYFIFNDHIKNLDVDIKKAYLIDCNTVKKTALNMVKIDSEGNQYKSNLFTYDESKMVTEIKFCKQISADEFLIYTEKKKENRYIKIELK